MYITHISNGWNACTSNNTILSICYPYGPWYLKKSNTQNTSSPPPPQPHHLNFLLRKFYTSEASGTSDLCLSMVSKAAMAAWNLGWATVALMTRGKPAAITGDTEIASTLVNVVTIDVHWCTVWTISPKLLRCPFRRSFFFKAYGMLGLLSGTRIP